MGGGGAEAKKAGVFAWEKNVVEMNEKGTCPRLLVKKKRKRKMRCGPIRRKAAKTREVKSLVERKHIEEDKEARGSTLILFQVVTDKCEWRHIHVEKLQTEGLEPV